MFKIISRILTNAVFRRMTESIDDSDISMADPASLVHFVPETFERIIQSEGHQVKSVLIVAVACGDVQLPDWNKKPLLQKQ